MILNYHVTDYEDLTTRTEEEDLFSKELMFTLVDKVIAKLCLLIMMVIIYVWTLGDLLSYEVVPLTLV